MPIPNETMCIRIAQRLLDSAFEGREMLQSQLRSARVTLISDERAPGAKFAVTQTADRPTLAVRVPAEAVAIDSDGVRIHALLHVVDGLLDELEIFREDGKPLIATPDITSWELRP
jgi:hypothetical protein